MSATQQLGQRALDLEAKGGDTLRIDMIQRARRFKRSWIEMAEGLVQLRLNRAYEQWGYRDFYSYCADELLVKRRTVDKLTGSYQVVEQHAPAMLRQEQEVSETAPTMPSLDCVDYFARAVGKPVNDDGTPNPSYQAPPTEVVEQLHEAVFSSAQPLKKIREQFDEVLFPRSPEDDALLVMKRANSAALRLRRLLIEIEGLDRNRSKLLLTELEGLEDELAGLIEAAKARAERDAA